MIAMGTTREAFDALVQRRVMALSEAAVTSSSNPAALDEAHAGQQEAQLLEASASEFADAVDRSDTGLAYEDAVVLIGSSGVVVVSDVEWRATPVYCEARAGEVDTLIQGSVLVAYLRGEADSPAS